MNTLKSKLKFNNNNRFYCNNVKIPTQMSTKWRIVNGVFNIYITGFYMSIIGFGCYGCYEAYNEEYIHKNRKFEHLFYKTVDGMTNGCCIGFIWPIVVSMKALHTINNE